MDKPNSGGDTPLHVCAREGKDKFFYAFIDAGASISVDSQNGRVINLVLQFILTDEKRRYDWIEKVIETEKEEVNVRETKFGSRPMHWARTKADVDQLRV
jgi:ankyrin repeat protein